MNRSSNRETRLVALETQVQDIDKRQEIMVARMDRIDERLDLLTNAVLKLSRELGAQRDRYPLGGN